MRIHRIATAFLLFFYIILPVVASAETNGSELDVRLFIIGPGDPVYSFWGHTGLAIRDKRKNSDIFFDFGNFYFEDENFFKNFAVGRLLYMAYAAYTQPYIRSVISENRELTEYVLNLPPEKKKEMYEALKEKTRPENRTYLYHHYNDNCSTRIRNYINEATDGALREQSEQISGSTYRESFLRFTSQRKLIGSSLSLLQGTPIDGKINLWQEMFLPAVMEDFVSSFSYRNSRGELIPLVSEINILNKAEGRVPVPAKYERPFIQALLIGLALSALILFLHFRSFEKGRKLYGAVNIAAALLIGVTGSVLLFLAGFTDHSYAYYNLNLFMLNPLALFIIPAAVFYIRRGEPWRRRMEILWLIQVFSSAIMIAIKIFTPVHQDNMVEIIVFFPLLFVLSPIIPAGLRKFKLLGKIPDPSLQSGDIGSGSR
ncbi:MAG: DUF4105 domain-containing protein [Spirochaetales bacterium]|nr:DUF4105 domain-containing protein [Spirochaetales bacterium]